MFKRATGWLGWSPEAALTTPIPQIELAFEGFIDCKVKTNPFGSGDGGGDRSSAQQQDAQVAAPATVETLRHKLHGLFGTGDQDPAGT